MLRVAITDLQSYNEGHLVFEWLELPCSEEELSKKCDELLTKGAEISGFGDTHEEYFITDYEFETETKLFEVNEYSNLNELNEKCEELSEYDEDDLKKIGYLMNNVGFDYKDALQKYDEVTIYENTTLEEICEEYIENTINLDEIPDIIKNNIDYKSISYEFEISGEYERIEQDIFFFVNC